MCKPKEYAISSKRNAKKINFQRTTQRKCERIIKQQGQARDDEQRLDEALE